MLKNKIICCALLLAALVTAGCGVTIKYSLSGASLPPDAKTFSVDSFTKNKTMVEPRHSRASAGALGGEVTRLAGVGEVGGGGDFAFEGEITGYSSTTASVASDDYALLNRLSITVKVRFTNVLDEAMSFNKSFTAYAAYDSTKLLTEVAGELVPEIVDQLVNDIFQAAASNW